MITVLIVDDHPVVRDGLRGIFESTAEFEVAGEAGNGAEAVTRARALRPPRGPPPLQHRSTSTPPHSSPHVAARR